MFAFAYIYICKQKQNILSVKYKWYISGMKPFFIRLICISETVFSSSRYPCVPRVLFDVKMQFYGLTHWGGDKMAAIFETTFLNAFSWNFD